MREVSIEVRRPDGSFKVKSLGFEEGTPELTEVLEHYQQMYPGYRFFRVYRRRWGRGFRTTEEEISPK